jgi:DNA repair protein RecO (recombination protein O)
MKVKSLGIPLRCVDFSDTSQVVSLFTRELGLVEGIAKGAHRPRNSFQGPFDQAVVYEAVFIPRPRASLSLFTEAEVADGLRGLRATWEKYLAAALLIEFLRAMSSPFEPQPELFDLALSALRALEVATTADIRACLLRFEVRALRLGGFLGSVDACVRCERSWPGGKRPALFSPQAGGLVCRRCALGSPRDPTAGELPGACVRLLQGLAGSAADPDAPQVGETAQRLLHGLLLRTCIILLERSFRVLQYCATWI